MAAPQKEMTMTMTKKLAVATFLGSILAGAGLAHAGLVGNTQVTISTTGGLDSANGMFRATRNSADANQYIGCSRYAYDTGSTSIVCYAQNAAGTYKSCNTGNDQMLRVAETLNPAAYLYFVVNTDGTCDRVITTLTSYNL
jgi:hypothetical protein